MWRERTVIGPERAMARKAAMKIQVSGFRRRYISSSVTTTATTTRTTRRTARTVGKYAELAAGALTALGLAFAARAGTPAP